MGLARDLELRISFGSRGANQLHRDLQMLNRDMRAMGGRAGSRAMSISYGAEQAATQLTRVSQGARRSLEATVGLAADFEDQMGRVGAISTRGMGENEAARTMNELSRTARELGASTRYTAREAGAGMEFLAMAGFDAQKQIKTIPAVLNLATVGHIEVARAADIATNVMGGFQLEAGKSTMVVDQLAAALTGGNVTMEELGLAMSYAAPQAKALGMELHSVLGWMDVLGDAGIKGSKAGTGTRSILLSLSKAAGDKDMRKLFKSYGVDMVDDAGNLIDPTTIMGQLGLGMARSGKTNVELTKDVQAIFGKRFGTTASVLMASGAVSQAAAGEDISTLSALLGKDVTEDQRDAIYGESLDARIGKVFDSQGLSKTMAEKMDATTKGQWRAFKSALEETGIVIGEEILPLLIDLMNEFKPLVLDLAQWAKKHPDLIKGLAKTMIAVAGIGMVMAPILHLVSAGFGLMGLGQRMMGGSQVVAPLARGLAAAGGAGGAGRGPGRARTVDYDFILGDDVHGPAHRRTLDLKEYQNQRGWVQTQRGTIGWQAGGGPDAVWASPEAEYAQRQRTRTANRRSRRGGFGRSSKGYAKWQAQQAMLRQEEKLLRKRERVERRASRRAARRAAGIGKAGAMDVAAYSATAFSLGMAIGEGLNVALKNMTGTTLTGYFEQALEGAGMADGIERWARWKFRLEDVPTEADLPILRQRVKPIFAEENAEGKKRQEAFEKDQALAQEMGVTVRTIGRARAQGYSDKHMRNQAWMTSFVMSEQLKDAESARKEEYNRKRVALAGQAAVEARVKTESEGGDRGRIERAGMVAYNRSMGVRTGIAGDIYDAVARAIRDGVDGANPLLALIPREAVTGAEAGG